jgi:hypothetical protein
VTAKARIMLGLLRRAGDAGVSWGYLIRVGIVPADLVAEQLTEAGFTVETRRVDRGRGRLPEKRYLLLHDPGEQLELTG